MPQQWQEEGGVRDHGEKIAKPGLGSNTVSSISIINTNTVQIIKYKNNNFFTIFEIQNTANILFPIHLQIP